MSNTNHPSPQEEFKFLNDEIGFEQESFWTRFSGFATLHAGLLVLITSEAVKYPQFLARCAFFLAVIWVYVQGSSLFYVNRYKPLYHEVRERCGYPHIRHPFFSKFPFSPTDIAILVPMVVIVIWFRLAYPEYNIYLSMLLDMNAQILNTIGLVLNISGVILLFFFGFPQPSLEEGISLGISGLKVEEHNRKVRKLRTRYHLLSRTALSLILFGFLFQLWATWR